MTDFEYFLVLVVDKFETGNAITKVDLNLRHFSPLNLVSSELTLLPAMSSDSAFFCFK